MQKSPNSNTKNKQLSALFNVFTHQSVGLRPCQGNTALVSITEKLPSLTEHLELMHSKQNTSKLPRNVTFVYLSNTVDKKALKAPEFSIRWFSRTSPIQRCGHGTLAAAAFISNYRAAITANHSIRFYSDREILDVYPHHDKQQYTLRLQCETLLPSDYQPYVSQQVVRENKTAKSDGYLIMEFDTEQAVKDYIPSQEAITAIGKRALIISAKSHNNHYDIVFRYFAPFYGELEDSVTGSAGSLLMPFWQQWALTKQHGATCNNNAHLRCYQASEQGGFFTLRAPAALFDKTARSNTSSVDVVGYITEK